ncbi:MAG: universal stress protein [Mycobacterium sp.]
MNELFTSQPIVVGIDGSNAAIQAALWAVPEAVSRDVPLRLLHVIEQGDALEQEPAAMARKRTPPETAVSRACMAIEAMGQPVKIETEIAQGPLVGSLIRASASAAMLCVGALGIHHFRPGRVGSTAAALAISAQCPVAIIRDHHNQPGLPAHGIVVEIDTSSDHGVLLGAAMEVARLRNATIQAVICDRTGSGNDETVRDDSRLARWRRRYPNLGVDWMAVRGSLLDYLAQYHRSAQLLIVGAHDREHLKKLVGPVGSAVLQAAQCSLLIVNRQHL